MGALISKLPGWVQPYTPSHSIDWESVSMDHDSLLRFTDPLVAQEFTVYKQRDLIPTFIMMVFVIGGNFFMLTRVVWLPWILIPICLIPAYGNLACLVSDTVTFFQQGKLPATTAQAVSLQNVYLSETPKNSIAKQELGPSNEARRASLANRRWAICFASLIFHCVEVELAARWGMYDKHCRQAPDWFAFLGLRADPTTYMSPTEISYYCSQSPSPFHAMTSSFAWSVLPLLTAHIVPIYLLGFLLRALAELYPRDVPWAFEDVATDTAIQIFLMVLYVSLHAIRHRTSMNQFIQEINLRIATNQAERKEEEVDTLLCSMLPFSALERLSSNQPVADYAEHATVLFSDVRSFTAWSSTRSAQEVVSMLNTLCLEIDLAAEKRRVEKVKTIGDGYWAVAGLPDHCSDHAESMCNFGNAMLDIVAAKNKLHPEWDGIEIRIGIHTGPLHGGILGTSQLSYEVFGPTSTIAGKVEPAGVPGRVVVSEVTLDYIGVPLEKRGRPFKALEGVTVAAPNTENQGDEPKRSPKDAGEEPVEQDPLASIQLYVIPRTLDVVKAYESEQAFERRRSLHAGERRKSGSSTLVGSSTPMSQGQQSTGSRLSSMRGTRSLKSWNGDLAKKKRAEFLARRAAAKMDASEEGVAGATSETLEEVIARYSKRKYEYIFCEFADPEVESQFISYLTKQQSKLRIGVRLGVLGLLAIVMISILTHSSRTAANRSYSLPAAFFFFPVAAVLGIADLALCFLMEKIFAPRAQAALQIVTMLLVVLGAGLMPPGSSYTTNDTTYIFIILAPLLGFGNSGLVSAVSLVGTLGIVFVPLMMWLVWDVVLLTMDFFFFMTMLMMVLPFIVITERVYRIQFLQFHTAEYFKQKQEQRTKEQEALLGSMVPAHIVKDLMVWMQTGMDPTKTIIQTLPVTATVFLQIDINNRELLADLLSSPANPLNETAFQEPTSNTSFKDLLVDVEPPEEETPLIMPNHWLQDIHEKVDQILTQYKSFVKIKTIGECVMLAGPFTDTYDLTTTCDEMLAAVSEILGFARLRAGLHCGELVGAVQGRTRLCYDIFGDTVNTASRTMTSGSMGEISVSEEFYNSLPGQVKQHPKEREKGRDEVVGEEMKKDGGSRLWLTQGAKFSEDPIMVAAKGKGEISVRRFLSM